ncbi:MAG: hypothetical protein P1U32_06815 [Legionellaceae bacterium]|nr:hypothetical protein [Legionellaceae bacterium]
MTLNRPRNWEMWVKDLTAMCTLENDHFEYDIYYNSLGTMIEKALEESKQFGTADGLLYLTGEAARAPLDFNGKFDQKQKIDERYERFLEQNKSVFEVIAKLTTPPNTPDSASDDGMEAPHASAKDFREVLKQIGSSDDVNNEEEEGHKYQ